MGHVQGYFAVNVQATFIVDEETSGKAMDRIGKALQDLGLSWTYLKLDRAGRMVLEHQQEEPEEGCVWVAPQQLPFGQENLESNARTP